MTAMHGIHFERYEKNQETYLRAKKYNFKTINGKITYEIENLIDGNPELSNLIQSHIDILMHHIYFEV